MAHQLRETGACCLFAAPELLDRAREAASGTDIREVIVFGEAPGATPFAALLRCDGPAPDVAIDPREDVVAILCSSGTTGLPKGVQLTHFNVVASAARSRRPARPARTTRCPATSPSSTSSGLIGR